MNAVRIRLEKAGDISLILRETDAGTSDFSAYRIQKGLSIAHRNNDLSEEGVGFGVPLLKEHEAIFPGRARISTEKDGDATVLKVEYDYNLVERMAVRGNKITGSASFYRIKEYLSLLHRECPGLRKMLTQGSIALRRTFGIETRFEEIASKGVVNVVYAINSSEGTIHVSVDTCGVKKKGCTEVIIMNEQGANHFDSYRDSNGTTLVGNAIGTWDETFADEASFIDSLDKIAFTLFRVRGSRMFRGRELVANRLAWSGLAYVIPRHAADFAYKIKIGAST